MPSRKVAEKTAEEWLKEANDALAAAQEAARKEKAASERLLASYEEHAVYEKNERVPKPKSQADRKRNANEDKPIAGRTRTWTHYRREPSGMLHLILT
jgi:hypothetical protein